MKNILVLCTGNSCRSQIAEGYLRYFADGQATIYSAGIETHGVNPRAIAARIFHPGHSGFIKISPIRRKLQVLNRRSMHNLHLSGGRSNNLRKDLCLNI